MTCDNADSCFSKWPRSEHSAGANPKLPRAVSGSHLLPAHFECSCGTFTSLPDLQLPLDDMKTNRGTRLEGPHYITMHEIGDSLAYELPER